MIVYIESNFILEIVLKQKHAVSAEAIFRLAEQSKIELVYPSFALSEPFATLTHRERYHAQLAKSVAGTIEGLSKLLTEAAKQEQSRLWLLIERLIAIGTPIETSKTCFKEAFDYQDSLKLSQQDSIMYASVMADLQQRPHVVVKCFLDSNAKDFKTPAIIAELNSYNCYYEENFAKGLNYINYHIERGN